MQLVGMLDSPYVRRVAVSLRYLEIPFEQSEISVFRSIEAFGKINPLLKAPSLVCDDGEVLMDSTLILEYAARIAKQGRTLMPQMISDYQRAIRLIGLGLNACDKSVQIEYERKRPTDRQYQPWRDRIQAQLTAAYDLIEPYAADADDWLVGGRNFAGRHYDWRCLAVHSAPHPRRYRHPQVSSDFCDFPARRSAP